MRIVCPSCQATYDVPESLMRGAPRRVRCARCGGEWTPEGPQANPDDVNDANPPAIQAAAPALPPDQPALVMPDPAAPRTADRMAPPPRPSGRGAQAVAIAAWIASLLALVGLGWAGFAWRVDIMAMWAPSKRLYALLGLLE